jgi:hypothetical protein
VFFCWFSVGFDLKFKFQNLMLVSQPIFFGFNAHFFILLLIIKIPTNQFSTNQQNQFGLVFSNLANHGPSEQSSVVALQLKQRTGCSQGRQQGWNKFEKSRFSC